MILSTIPILEIEIDGVGFGGGIGGGVRGDDDLDEPDLDEPNREVEEIGQAGVPPANFNNESGRSL